MATSPDRQLSILTQIKVLFGGGTVQIGSIIFWVLMSIIAWYVGAFGWGLYWGGEWVPTSGIYQGVDYSNVEVNEEPVYTYYFAYNVEGQSYEGVSYAYYRSYTEGEVLEVEYRSNNPTQARIVGMTTSPIGNIFLFIMLGSALIPFIILLVGFRKNQKYFYLLRHGRIAQGTYLRSRPTNVKINEETVYEYEFSFEVNGQSFVAKCKTHHYDRVEDEETETILYDPRDPKYNMVSDAVSNIKPVQSENKLGRMARAQVPRAGISALFYLLFPVGGMVVALLVWSMTQ